MTMLPPGPKGPGMSSRLSGLIGPRPLLQLAVLAAVLLTLVAVAGNVAAAMARSGISPGFAFLTQRASFEIGESVIDYAAGNTYGRALLVGLLNTAKVAFWGCILATLLGIAVSLAALSSNPALRRIERAYVDILRGTPLLLQLFVWTGLFQGLPVARQALTVAGVAFLSNRGIMLPAPGFDGLPSLIWLPFLLALAAFGAVFARRLLVGKSDYGLRLSVALIGGIFAGTLLLGIAGYAPHLDLPVKGGFNIRGGLGLTPEFSALLTGLVVNSSATVAEIIRSGIQSVKPGQWEAAKALGLTPGQTLRLVIWPQALRVIIPLMTSSYLDLTKNSSLAVAIGYPDLVSVANTTANTTGQVVEAILLIMLVYLSLNLLTSFFMNRFNRRIALKGGLGL